MLSEEGLIKVLTKKGVWKTYIHAAVERRKHLILAHSDLHHGKTKISGKLKDVTWPFIDRDLEIFL